MSKATPAATKLALLATLAVTAAVIALFVTGRRDTAVDSGFVAPFLWVLSALFLVRVVGQLLVRLRRPTWLPPTEEWNLSPYLLLLPAQLGILAVMAWIDSAAALGHGPPVRPHPSLGKGVLFFAYVYAGTMAVRYVIRMSRQPDQRWFGGTIPIVFHWVLAAYLYVFAWFHATH